MTYRGMTVEEIKIAGDKGTSISAYTARPSGPGPFPGVVLVHHLPGWSEIYCEFTRKFAHHGYIAICANLYERSGQGNPDDVAAKVRAEGGVPDAQVVGDTEGAVKWIRAQPGLNSKVGIFGTEDRAPSPEQVNQHEAELKKHGKAYEFHRYDGAGHGIFYYHRPMYR